jgi:DNA polymerase-3 subunit gamma/tau
LKVTLAEAGEQSGETLAQARTRAANERQAAAEQAIADDPVVKTLAQRFGAVVRQGSIQPLDESTENDAPAAVR